MNIDPLAEDYHFYSSYHFSANNPVLYLEVDGKYYVDADGNRVDISLNDDGQIQLGDNATEDLIELVNYVNSSGSADAIAQVLEGGLNKSMIHIKVESGEVDNGLFGLHQAHDKDGNVLEWDSEKGDFNGTPEYVEGEEGVYKEATITVFKGNIEKSGEGHGYHGNAWQEGIKLSAGQATAATFAHEVNHNTDKEFISDLKNRREQKPNKNIDPHTNITPNEVRIWSQMNSSNQKKKN